MNIILETEKKLKIKEKASVSLPFQNQIFWQGENKILSFSLMTEDIYEYELKMLQYCDIKGVLKPMIQRQDNQIQLYFDISQAMIKNEKSAAKQYLTRLQKLKVQLPNYLLSIEGIVVNAQYSFYFEATEEWNFLYLPLKEKVGIQDFEFFREFFYETPELFLQMEMMKENAILGLADYLEAVQYFDMKKRY